ncbi:hypothetical protein SADUNF_Sadunf02G0198600 [Salix dunnii]|uniref:Bifunctional inhibitor/plant lipid transfer protein/seed storage helical domain-containing protein n=1 Tax=Salix dunnii TaxID=1413687 RepID=A0A835N8N9_9ROSI|nr:hypothetical protein SADUNF_Sadunf02G0198600 [Salix dunnii]
MSQSCPRDPESCQFMFTGSQSVVLASKTLSIYNMHVTHKSTNKCSALRQYTACRYKCTDRLLLIFMMEMGKRQLVVLLLVMAALFEGSRAVSVCDISDDGLAACKPSVTKPDPVDPPSVDCCKAVSGANFTCLCSYKNSYLLPYLGIDPDLAMALPSKCNLSIPTPTC